MEVREFEKLVCSIEYHRDSGYGIILIDGVAVDGEHIVRSGTFLNCTELGMFAKWWLARRRAVNKTFGDAISDGLSQRMSPAGDGEPASAAQLAARVEASNGVCAPQGSLPVNPPVIHP